MTDLDALVAEGRSLLGAASPTRWSVDGHSHARSGCRCFTCHDDPTVWQTSNMVDCDETAASDAESCETAGYSLADAELIVWARNHLKVLLDALTAAHTVADAAAGLATVASVSMHTHRAPGSGAREPGCLACSAKALHAVTKPWANYLARQENSDG